MSSRPKVFQFIDVPRFAQPDILRIDPRHTAQALLDRVGGGYLSYGSIWSKMGDLVRGPVDNDFLRSNFNFYKDDWKNTCLQEVCRELGGYFGGRGNWYPERERLKPILGTVFRPARQGVWFAEGRPYEVLINARKRQRLSPFDASFLARAMYELHGRDDPNEPSQTIIDLSALEGKRDREKNVFNLDHTTAMSLEGFEEIMKLFFEALSIAGIAKAPPKSESISDLFRRK